MTRLAILLLFCLAVPAFAQTGQSGASYPAGCPLNGLNCTATATGGSSSQTTAQSAAQTANVLYFSGFGNTLRKKVAVTTTNGGSTLTVGMAIFSSSDCAAPASGCTGSVLFGNKVITVQGASVQSATGSIATIPVASAGSLYTGFPVCAISDTGGGQYATCAAEFQLQNNPTIASGGTGYPVSATFNATLLGGLCQIDPVINVTTNSSGVITTVNSIATGGLCTNPPGQVNGGWFFAPLKSYVGTAGGSGASFNPTYNVGGVLVLGGGVGYGSGTITATLSGATQTTAATLGTPTTTTPSATWWGTITSFVSSTQVGVSGTTFGTALSGAQRLVTWGNDDCNSINNAMTAVGVNGPTNGGALWFHAPLNGAMYGTTCELVKPKWPITFYGDNPFNTEIILMAQNSTDLLHVDDSQGVGYPDLTPGFASYNIEWNGNGLTPIVVNLVSVLNCEIQNNYITGAVYAGAALSANIANKASGTANSYGCNISHNRMNPTNDEIVDPSFMPLYNIYNGGSDNHFESNDTSNAMIANNYDATGGNSGWRDNHGYGYPYGYTPEYCGYWTGAARVADPACDGGGVAAYHIAGGVNISNFSAAVIGDSGTLLEVAPFNGALLAQGGLSRTTNPYGLDLNLVNFLVGGGSAGQCVMGVMGASRVNNFCPTGLSQNGTVSGSHTAGQLDLGQFSINGAKGTLTTGFETNDYFRFNGKYWASTNYGAGKGQIATFTWQATSNSATTVHLTADGLTTLGGQNLANLNQNNMQQAWYANRINANCGDGSAASWKITSVSAGAVTFDGLMVIRKTGGASLAYATPAPPTITALGGTNTGGTVPTGWAVTLSSNGATNGLDTADSAIAIDVAGACPTGGATVHFTMTADIAETVN